MKAFITISFGTTYDEIRKITLENIEKLLKESYPSFDHYSAWTSNIVISRMKKRNYIKKTPEEKVEELIKKGYKKIFIQPTHLLAGNEYKKILKARDKYKNKKRNIEISVGSPLFGRKNSLIDIIKIIKKEYGLLESTGYIFMGHGSSSKDNGKYHKLNRIIREKQLNNIIIATVEGTPSFDDVKEWIKKNKYDKYTLIPLMFIAAEHIKEDLLGKDSWKEQLLSLGYKVEGVDKGLGEIEDVQKLLISYAKKSLKGKGWI